MYQTYPVQEGDTILSIAKRLDLDPYEIGKLNGILLDTPLRSGTYIVIPSEEHQVFDVYTIQKGDSLYSIAQKFGVNLADLTLLNGLEPGEYIYPNETLLVPKKGVRIYVTKEGDTLNGVITELDALPLELVLQNEKIYLVPNQLVLYRKENVSR